MIASGANHSTLGPIVARAAAGMNVRLTPDPLPAEGLFTRSDHNKFVREGVPAVFLMTGFAGPGEERFKTFLATHRHQPSDDLKLPIDRQAGARFVEINFRIAREIANADAAPRWNADSFFAPVAVGRGVAAGARWTPTFQPLLSSCAASDLGHLEVSYGPNCLRVNQPTVLDDQ